MVLRDSKGLSLALALAALLCALFVSVVLAVTFSTTPPRDRLSGAGARGLASNTFAQPTRPTPEEEAMVEKLRETLEGQRP